MIKFLHTADLHLGKVFHDQSLLEDQEVMLEGLTRLLEDDSYAALVIAGDVYDRSVPPPEAVQLFGSFLAAIKKRRPSLEVIVIPGNHDSAPRLGFGRELFARLGIHLAHSASDCCKPVIVTQGDESCAFFPLPFLNPGALPVDGENGPEPLRSQSAMAEEAARRVGDARRARGAGNTGGAYSVLAAHLFASGGAEAGSERVFLGNAELVNINLFKGFDYIALGHLHRCQNVGGKTAGADDKSACNAWYSGSPLAYSFAETTPDGHGQEKFFLSVELGKDGTKVEKIPVTPLRKVTSLSGPFSRFSADSPGDRELIAAADDYLEIRLTDRGITENARDILRRRFPHLLSLRQDEALAGLLSGTGAPDSGEDHRSRKDKARGDIAGDFRDFLSCLYGKPEETAAEILAQIQEEIELFDSLLAETEEPA